MADLLRTRPALLPLLVGLRAPVDRRAYLGVGLGLAAVKYAVEAAAVLALTGAWMSPLAYLSPLVSLRAELLVGLPELWLGVAGLWSLPFAWVGATMSVRRARDAGLHPAWGLGFLVPVLNIVFIGVLAWLPSRPQRAPEGPSTSLAGPERGVAAALVGVAAGGAAGVVLVAVSTLLLGGYGAGLFLGGPFLMSAVAGFLYNLRQRQALLPTLAVGLATQGAAAGLLLLFALEGLICLAMAAPLAVAAGLGGALLGRELARLEDPRAGRALTGSLVALPLLVGLEPDAGQRLEHMVESEVVVAAPPAAVWDVVLAFPEIPETGDEAWFYRAGVAMPLRARIEGTGPGAVRHCEFTTGAFVEPVTTWDPPHRLAFDVRSQPAPMAELSPWTLVHAPHILDGTLTSRRGAFVLEPLAGGRTRLIGRTWYTIDMGPNAYWALWVDALVHRIHLRVLDHIGRVAAGTGRAAPSPRDGGA